LSSIRLRGGRTRTTGKRTRYTAEFEAKVALAGGEMLGKEDDLRRQRRVDDRQGIFGWVALDEASPAEASHYERPAPKPWLHSA
jgi:hypothetical protein